MPVFCLETRHAHRVLSAGVSKTDRNDARGLAKMMRVGWFKQAWLRGAPTHAIPEPAVGGCLLLLTKRTLENTLRGAVKRFGLILTKTSGRGFGQRVASVLDQDPAYVAFATPISGPGTTQTGPEPACRSSDRPVGS